MEELKRLNEDPYFGRLYYREEDRDRLMITGREEGIRDNSVEVAKKLKQNSIDINIISDSTGLSIDEINKL